MTTQETDQLLALRIKSKMERYGYSPTLEAILASVVKARGTCADLDKVKGNIRRSRVGWAVERMDRGAASADVEWMTSPESIAEAAADFVSTYPESTAWTDYLEKLAQDTGRDYSQLRAEARAKGNGVPPWANGE